jgi:hypothetical protein
MECMVCMACMACMHGVHAWRVQKCAADALAPQRVAHPACSRRAHVSVRALAASVGHTLGEVCADMLVLHSAHQLHAAAEACAANHGLEVRAHGAVAADDDTQARMHCAEARQNRDREVDALAVHQPTQHHEPALRGALMRA